MKEKIDNRKAMITFLSDVTLALHVRVEYEDIDCEINQSERGFTAD